MLVRYYTPVAEMLRTMGPASRETPTIEAVRGLIAEASRHLEMDTHRRFDRFMATYPYTARHVSDKGDLISSGEMSLKYDCQSVTAVTNLGTAVTLSELSLSGDPDYPFFST